MALIAVAGVALPASAFGSTTPAQPVVVGAVTNVGANAPHLSGLVSVAVSGHYAYTTAYWPGELTVVDISNPAGPQVVGHTAPTTSLENGSNITIVGTRAFVVSKNRNASSTSNDDGSGNSLTVVDISSPTAPTVLGSVHDANKLFGAYGIAVSGNYAYVAYQGLLGAPQPQAPDTSAGGFSVIDLTNLAAGVVANIDNGPVTGGTNYFRHATSVAISGHYAYVTAFNNASVTVVDIANPLAPAVVTSLHDPTDLPAPVDLAVSGNHLFVVNQTFSHQITVIDISNPSAPVVVSSRTSGHLNGAYRIRIRGSFAYVSASSASTVAALDLTYPATPRLAGLVQDAGHLNFTTGLDVDPSGGYVIATSPFLSTEANVNFPPYPPSVPNTGTLSVIQLDPSPISVSFVPATLPPNPSPLGSADIDFTVSDAIYTAQCSLDGAPLTPCQLSNSWKDSSLAAGSHTVTVVATDTSGHTAKTSYTWVVGSTRTPASTSRPTISGIARQGNRLTARLGSWTGYPTPTLADKWQRCNRHGGACSDIPGATATTYVATLGDVGSRLRVAVKGTNAAGSTTTQSGLTAVVVSNATASFRGIARRAASLHITVTGAGGGAQITRVIVGLPNSIMRFGAPSARHLAGAVVVRNGASHRLRIRVAIRFGALVITLRKPAGKIHIVIAGTVFEVKNSFAQMVKRKKKLTATVVLDVIETRGVHTHDQLPARAS